MGAHDSVESVAAKQALANGLLLTTPEEDAVRHDHADARHIAVGSPSRGSLGRPSRPGSVARLPDGDGSLSSHLAGEAITPLIETSKRSSQPNGPMTAIVDYGPLYAAIDADDDYYSRCLEVLERCDLDLIVSALVVADVTYLVGRRLGAGIESELLRGLASLEVEAPAVDDWPSIADLVERYGDFPLGGTDASVSFLGHIDPDRPVDVPRVPVATAPARRLSRRDRAQDDDPVAGEGGGDPSPRTVDISRSAEPLQGRSGTPVRMDAPATRGEERTRTPFGEVAVALAPTS